MFELLLLACAGGPKDTSGETGSGDTADSGETAESGDTGESGDTADSADTAESGDTGETGETGDPVPDEQIVMYCGDTRGEACVAWADWLATRGAVETWLWDDEGAPLPPPDALVVLGPDLPSEASGAVALLTAHGGPVLGVGLGGARAYDGLEVGMGAADSLATSVDGLVVADGQDGHPVYAGIVIPEGGNVTLWPEAASVVGLEPPPEMEVLGWDDRYVGTHAVLGHLDRYWYWGWGRDSGGYPGDMNADGDAVLRALVDYLLL